MRACSSSTKRWPRWRDGDVDDFAIVEEIFCQLFSACEYAHDVDRADQWIRVGEDIATRRNLPAVAAFCQTHYGGLLTAAGRWGEADVALSDAVRIWGLGHSSLRPGRAGASGRAAGSTGSVRRGRAAPRGPRRGRRGGATIGRHPSRARPSPTAPSPCSSGRWTRSIPPASPPGRCGPRSSTPTSPEATTSTPRPRSTSWSAAPTATRGPTCGPRRRWPGAGSAWPRPTGDPCGCLREALSGFLKARTPMELAQARFELAKALAIDQPEGALVEARAALGGLRTATCGPPGRCRRRAHAIAGVT